MEIIILGIIIFIGYHWFKAKTRVENAKRHQNEKQVQNMMEDMASDIKKELDAQHKRDMDMIKDLQNK